MKIIFYDTKPFEKYWFEKINNNQHQIKYLENDLNEDNIAQVKGYDAICAFVNTEGNEKIIQILAKYGIKFWLQRSMGYNKIDLKAAEKYQIKVFRVPNYSAESVAEHALALMLSLNRNLIKAHQRVQNWNFLLNDLEGKCLHDSTVGIIGAGKIGQSLIKIVRAMGAKVLVYDEYAATHNQQIATDYNFTFTSLNQLLTDSDFISLHAPLTKETFHLLNDESFSLMKKMPIIVNCARGELIDTQALIKALKNKQIAGAGLDVLENETNRFFHDLSSKKEILAKENHDWNFLLSQSNVLVTAHQAFLTTTALKQIATITLTNASNAEKGLFTTALKILNNNQVENG